jgi:hypothetical protein
LNVTRGQLEELLTDHEQLVKTHLDGGLRLGLTAKTDGAVVRGIGITENAVAGNPAGGAALLMLVDALDPSGASLPSVSEHGIPIIYEEVGEIRASAGYQAKYRPVQGGVSIAPCARQYSGTLGCVVQSNGTKYILSNNHVLADTNTLPAGSTISQQSIPDGGACPADVIASLSFFVPVAINGQTPVDAAIAAIARGVNFDPRILRDNGVVEKLVAPITAPVINMAVQKSGRTTGWTKAATVRAIALTIAVVYPTGQSTIHNTFSVKRVSGAFSMAGDSGSLITTDPGNQPVGLLFAGDNNFTTYANNLSAVLAALEGLTGAPVNVVY